MCRQKANIACWKARSLLLIVCLMCWCADMASYPAGPGGSLASGAGATPPSVANSMPSNAELSPALLPPLTALSSSHPGLLSPTAEVRPDVLVFISLSGHVGIRDEPTFPPEHMQQQLYCALCFHLIVMIASRAQSPPVLCKSSVRAVHSKLKVTLPSSAADMQSFPCSASFSKC